MADTLTIQNIFYQMFSHVLPFIAGIAHCWTSDMKGQYIPQMSAILNSKWPTFESSKSVILKFCIICSQFLKALHNIGFEMADDNMSANFNTKIN